MLILTQIGIEKALINSKVLRSFIMVLYDYVKTHRSVHHEERILLYVNKKKRLTMMWKELKMEDRL